MPVNQYFKSFQNVNEQALIDGLQAESIQVRGIDVHFIPRTLVNEDYLFGEDPVSAFNTYFVVEMYMENFEGFGQDTDLMSKFGLHVKDQMEMNVNVTSFRAITSLNAPLEGDLIYMPLAKALFEIKFVEDEEQFYALGKNYNWKLQAELFQFSHEGFATGDADVDSIIGLDNSDVGGGADPGAQNAAIETEGDAAMNFDETNPFGNF